MKLLRQNLTENIGNDYESFIDEQPTVVPLVSCVGEENGRRREGREGGRMREREGERERESERVRGQMTAKSAYRDYRDSN